jgi:hypothetical protein
MTAVADCPTDGENFIIVVDVAGGVLRYLLDWELQRERRHLF